MARLHDYLDFIANTQTLEDLWAGHTETMAGYGFDRLIYGFTRFRTQNSLGDPEDFTILTNHDEKYVDGFLHGGLYRYAPMLQWALQNEGSASWARLAERFNAGEMTTNEMKVVEFNLQNRVTAGYTISFKSVSARSKGAISLAARAGMVQNQLDEVWAKHGKDILVMNNMAHLKILSLPYQPPNRALTRRQREALEWVGDGKTTQDIAILMGLTAATVEKHLRLARESLSVETTAQAVLKASLHNQMFVLEA